MDYNVIADKSIALLIINSEVENDMHVFLGKIEKTGQNIFFRNHSKGWQATLNEEQLSRLKEVSQDLKEIFLGADYFISLYMENLSDDDKHQLESTGMTWH